MKLPYLILSCIVSCEYPSPPALHSASALREALKHADFIVAVVVRRCTCGRQEGFQGLLFTNNEYVFNLAGLCFLCITAYMTWPSWVKIIKYSTWIVRIQDPANYPWAP